jgi:hypothetical protein
MTAFCKHCGKDESDHHEFEARIAPKGCMCEPGTWSLMDEIPDVCEHYVRSIPNIQMDNYGYCQNCEHDKACHGGAKRKRVTVSLNKRRWYEVVPKR